MSASRNPSGILITQAQTPHEWPPAPDRAQDVLLDVFSQHLIARRDWVVRRAYETVVQRQPYARGRVHQRPFTALDGLELDSEVRDKLVDVVAVFVDEAIEHTLSLVGAATNLVGEHDAVEYELAAHLVQAEQTADQRFSSEMLAAEWRGQLNDMLAEEPTTQEFAATEDADGSKAPTPDYETKSSLSYVPISRGVPLWFEYRKWLSEYCTFRRSARPSRLT